MHILRPNFSPPSTPEFQSLSFVQFFAHTLPSISDLPSAPVPQPAALLLLPSPTSSSLALTKAMASHSSTLAWKIPWMEEPGGLQSIGSLTVGHDWVTSLSLITFMHWRRKWQPTPVFLPGEFHGRRSLVGCHLWGHTESDTTEVTQQLSSRPLRNLLRRVSLIPSFVHFQKSDQRFLSGHIKVPEESWEESGRQ